jgi:hypothetical protein
MKTGQNETNPKIEKTDLLRRRHLRGHGRISSHYFAALLPLVL